MKFKTKQKETQNIKRHKRMCIMLEIKKSLTKELDILVFLKILSYSYWEGDDEVVQDERASTNAATVSSVVLLART